MTCQHIESYLQIILFNLVREMIKQAIVRVFSLHSHIGALQSAWADKGSRTQRFLLQITTLSCAVGNWSRAELPKA